MARRGGKGRRRKRTGPTVRVRVDVHPDLVLDPERLAERAAKKAHIDARDIDRVQWVRRSIDARGDGVVVACELDLVLDPSTPRPEPPRAPALTTQGSPRVAIIGAGPAGLFCAHQLALLGIRSVVVERGKPVRERRHDLAALMQRGELNPESNYCFGEGGAGTFSDGKLYTRSAKRGDVRGVLETFVAYGATSDLLVDARPHIGTNRLPGVIAAMRANLESAGVDVLFSSRAVEIVQTDGVVAGLELADGTKIDVDHVVLAAGHSARDAIDMVVRAGGRVSAKSFAMGVRVEHPQALIDRLQFGELAGHAALGSAAYRVVERAGDVGVFSFCMCPGGFAVPASTIVGSQVVNGWSPASRRGRFANSGFVVEVGPKMLAAAGYEAGDVNAGLKMQRALETRAYEAGGGGYVAPGQRLSDFVEGVGSASLPVSSYPRGVQPARLDRLLGPLAEPLRSALRQVSARMPGYLGPEAIALGVESRTSSPVRLDRDPDTLMSIGLDGLYPAAEGAGYAGGIMSAALDGMRIAESIARSSRRPK